MSVGLLEKMLTRRYGPGVPGIKDDIPIREWNTVEPDDDFRLYFHMNWNGRLGRRFASLKEIYGDAFGGFLVGSSLKVATLVPRQIWGLWRIDELHMVPAVRQALEMKPGIDFFMNAGNVCYYGYKRGKLYVFDVDMDELDSLGPIEPALEQLMNEWITVGEP